MTIGNPAFCLTLHLTRVHIRGELQHVGDISKQKCNSRPIRTRETSCVRLSKALYSISGLNFSYSFLLGLPVQGY